MRKKAAIIIIAVVILIAISFFIQLYPPKKKFTDIVANTTFLKESDAFYDYEISRYPSSAEVVELRPENTLVGFDVDTTKVNFGTIPGSGSYSRKTINLTNLEAKNKRVYVAAAGNIKPYVNISGSEFMLKPGDARIVELFFYTLNGGAAAPVGNYTGEIDVIIQTPKYDFVYWFW